MLSTRRLAFVLALTGLACTDTRSVSLGAFGRSRRPASTTSAPAAAPGQEAATDAEKPLPRPPADGAVASDGGMDDIVDANAGDGRAPRVPANAADPAYDDEAEDELEQEDADDDDDDDDDDAGFEDELEDEVEIEDEEDSRAREDRVEIEDEVED